jgi:hypothetical protein
MMFIVLKQQRVFLGKLSQFGNLRGVQPDLSNSFGWWSPIVFFWAELRDKSGILRSLATFKSFFARRTVS